MKHRNLRRIEVLTLIAVLLLIPLCASASESLSDSLVTSVKKAFSSLAMGEYERVVQLLPFEGVSPGASEWARFADRMDVSSVQDSYALCYYSSGSWKIVVPATSKPTDSTPCLICVSKDGKSISDYGDASWGSASASAASAEKVVEK